MLQTHELVQISSICLNFVILSKNRRCVYVCLCVNVRVNANIDVHVHVHENVHVHVHVFACAHAYAYAYACACAYTLKPSLLSASAGCIVRQYS